MLGQHVIPESADLRVDCTPSDKVRTQMGQMHEVIRRAAASMPSHEETIARYCPADSAKFEA
jgi:tryptophan halogenase